MTVAYMRDGGDPHVLEPAPTRVLVADDATGIRELLCLLLGMEDDFVVVAQARDGREALDLAARERPDLVLLDIGMPRVDGMQALPRLRSLMPDATIVIFSSYDALELAVSAVERGADGYVEKDSTVTEIVDRLRELRDRRVG